MKIYFATANKSKFLEAESILAKKGVELVQFDMEFDEPVAKGQRYILLEKVSQAYKKIKKPVIVDDTAIYFDAYPNFPGAFTKDVMKRVGYDGIEKLLEGFERGAHFKCMMCLKTKEECRVFSGVWKGVIISRPSEKRNPDWTYDSIFVPESYSKPLSEVPLSERTTKSHRKKALMKLAKYLEGRK